MAPIYFLFGLLALGAQLASAARGDPSCCCCMRGVQWDAQYGREVYSPTAHQLQFNDNKPNVPWYKKLFGSTARCTDEKGKVDICFSLVQQKAGKDVRWWLDTSYDNCKTACDYSKPPPSFSQLYQKQPNAGVITDEKRFAANALAHAQTGNYLYPPQQQPPQQPPQQPYQQPAAPYGRQYGYVPPAQPVQPQAPPQAPTPVAPAPRPGAKVKAPRPPTPLDFSGEVKFAFWDRLIMIHNGQPYYFSSGTSNAFNYEGGWFPFYGFVYRHAVLGWAPWEVFTMWTDELDRRLTEAAEIPMKAAKKQCFSTDDNGTPYEDKGCGLLMWRVEKETGLQKCSKDFSEETLRNLAKSTIAELAGSDSDSAMKLQHYFDKFCSIQQFYTALRFKDAPIFRAPIFQKLREHFLPMLQRVQATDLAMPIPSVPFGQYPLSPQITHFTYFDPAIYNELIAAKRGHTDKQKFGSSPVFGGNNSGAHGNCIYGLAGANDWLKANGAQLPGWDKVRDRVCNVWSKFYASCAAQLSGMAQ